MFDGLNARNNYFNEEPIREELYNVEHLEQFAQALAAERLCTNTLEIMHKVYKDCIIA